MLAQVLRAGVHELDGVERAAAVFRVARRVGGDAVELVEHLYAGVVRAGDDLVHVARVPGQGEVKAAPQPLAGHEGLARAALLARAAVKDDRSARAAALEEVLYGEGSAQRARTEHVVPAAVPRPAGDERPLLCTGCRLAEAGERVVFAEDADHRPSLAESAAEGGGDAAKALRHLKAVRAQRVAVEPGGLCTDCP